MEGGRKGGRACRRMGLISNRALPTVHAHTMISLKEVVHLLSREQQCAIASILRFILAPSRSAGGVPCGEARGSFPRCNAISIAHM